MEGIVSDHRSNSSHSDTASVHAMRISATAMGKDYNAPTLQLSVTVQGHEMVFLVDSGSTHSFLDNTLMQSLQGVQAASKVSVTVAGGDKLQSSFVLPRCEWVCSEHTFHTTFRFLDLASYDGILGLDWLTQHSPMQVDWVQKWLSFSDQGTSVTLQRILPTEFAMQVVSISSLQGLATEPVPPELQAILDKHATIFDSPTGLPPRRAQDHKIPLIPGARPVSIRPYRIAPHMKDELEKQIKELLDLGMIRCSNSAFSSPVLLVRKKRRRHLEDGG